MAIFQLYDEKNKGFTETFDKSDLSENTQGKGRLFSTLVTRFCFLLLIIADAAWLVYNAIMLIVFSLVYLFSAGKKTGLLKKFALHTRRSIVCGLSLFVGLFSPPFGIMVACTYFLMYDKAGMEEVVPASLQAQFKEIFKTE